MAREFDRRARGAAVNSRGGSEREVRELQGAAMSASSSGRRVGRAAAASSEAKQGRHGERERERTGGRGLKVEDSNFRGVLCIYSCHMASY